MEPWSGCAWLQIMYTASEIAFLPDQGDIAITKVGSDQKNVVHHRQDRRLHLQGHRLHRHHPQGRRLHADTLPSRECLLDVIFSGSMRPQGIFLSLRNNWGYRALPR